MRIARIVGLIGRALVVAGLLLLFYTAYLLWGTSVYTRNAQNNLARHIESNPIVATIPTGEIPPARPQTKPKAGDPLFTIVIPKIGLKTVVVEGVNDEQLKLGPGHFPDSPWPGEDGNVPISGHRTTYGAPFYRLNELAAGDLIAVESGPVRYKYTVTEQQIVHPVSGYHVVENRGVAEITLTTCHPRFSAAQRLIVQAKYEGAELIQSQPAAARAPDGRTAGKRELVPAPPPAVPRQTLILAALALASFLSSMALSKRLRLTAGWITFALLAMAGLWTQVFPQILRLMPANY